MEGFSQQLQYLTSDKVGKVLNEGLTILYEEKPEHPVTFLANWLLNHCATVNNQNRHQEAEKTRQQLIAKANEAAKAQAKEQAKQQDLKTAQTKAEEEFKGKVQSHLYLEEILSEELPEFIKQDLTLPAVYIGRYGYLTKVVKDDDDEPNAHLDSTKEKVISYIGASKNQKFVVGRSLAAESGVTYDVLKPKEEEDQGQQPDEEGQGEAPKASKPSYLYVPDVTQEPRMSYLRIPRLGAFIAAPLVYKSTLNEAAFDEGVKERQRVQAERAEQKKEREAKEADYQQRLEDADGEEVKQIEEEWKNIVWEQINEKEFEHVVQEYVLCADTLGEDRGIPEEQRKQFEEIAKFFVGCWENSEKVQLSADIDLQLEYLAKFDKEEYLRDFNDKMEDYVARNERESDGEETEQKTNYHKAAAKANFYREVLLGDDIKGYLMRLKEFRLVKFLNIIQNALFMTGYSKEDINIPRTNLLNWKKTKNLINENDFFKKLGDYKYQGPKAGKVKSYATPQRILRRLEGITLDEVDSYNIGLGVLYRYVKQVLEARILDVEVRKTEKASQKAKRAQLIQEAENLKIAKQQALEQAKAAVAEDEEFNEQEWSTEWNESNPAVEIPEEVVDDVDEDMELEVA